MRDNQSAVYLSFLSFWQKYEHGNPRMLTLMLVDVLENDSP